jgi:methionyl-tRNA formyltransferase
MSQFSLPSLRLVIFTAGRPPNTTHTLIEAFKALGQQVLLVVTPRDPYHIYYGVIAYIGRDHDILVPNRMDRLPAMLAGLAPDLIFCSGFPLRFPPELLALPRLGCVNSHPSLLPKYRGPRPVFWQLMHGETQTGMTLHRMDADFNTGPILVQRTLDIAPHDDSLSMWEAFLKLEVSMLPEMLALVTKEAQGIPQPEDGASYAPLPGAAERQLDWTRPATQLYNQIRALAWEGAHALIDGQTMRVRRARVVCSLKVCASPGTLLACTAEGMLMQTGQDALMVTEYLSEDQIRRFAFPQKPGQEV